MCFTRNRRSYKFISSRPSLSTSSENLCFIPEITKDFCQCRIQEWSYSRMKLQFPNLWTVLNFIVLTPAGYRSATRFQPPPSKVQIPSSSVQLLHPESRNSGTPCRSENLHTDLQISFRTSLSSRKNKMPEVSHCNSTYCLSHAHPRYMKCLFTNIQKQ